MNTGLRLSPEESAEFLSVSERLDGFVAGVAALSAHLKQQKISEIIAARQPEPPKPAKGAKA